MEGCDCDGEADCCVNDCCCGADDVDDDDLGFIFRIIETDKTKTSIIITVRKKFP